MILSYYGGYVKRQKLIEYTHTTKTGTTAYHIKETLNNLGFNSKGIKCKLSDINKNNIILPCIASVIINNSYKHFVVLYEINFNKKYLIIGDPADKIKKLSFEDFEKIFNNVIVTFFPIKTLPIDKEISQYSFLLTLLKSHKKILLNLFILSIFITLFSILTSFYTEYMISNLNFYSKRLLLFIFFIFFSIYILKILSNFIRNKLLSYFSMKIDLELTLDIFNRIIKLPYHYYQNKKVGDIVSKINDLDNVRDMVSKVALSLFIDLPLTLLSLMILLLINKTLFLVAIIIIIFYFLIIIVFRQGLSNNIKKTQINKSEVSSYMVESISGFETIKGTSLENDIIDKFEKKYVKLLKRIFNYQNIYILQGLLKDIINDIGFIIITFIGCILVMEEKMSLGSLFTFSALLIYFLEPIKNIINLDTTIKEAKNSLRRVIELTTYEIKKTGVLNNFSNGDIIFKNLKFSFNDRDYILKDINLKIKKGSKVMVIGKSGGGKSTLFKLLKRYYNLNNNMILIGDTDLNNYTDNTINNNISYIGQNEILFNDTLYNNLIFDDSDSSKLVSTSKICCIDDIMDSNLGYNMLIEENGFNLSGGERQRIVLARSLLKQFNILVIDEGLSQVDIDMERIILKRLFEEFKDKTIILISHRLDNLDLFDKLVKLDNGRIKEVSKFG